MSTLDVGAYSPREKGVVGLLGALLYFHGWRITDRFSERY